jgi:hypothetical protein
MSPESNCRGSPFSSRFCMTFHYFIKYSLLLLVANQQPILNKCDKSIYIHASLRCLSETENGYPIPSHYTIMLVKIIYYTKSTQYSSVILRGNSTEIQQYNSWLKDIMSTTSGNYKKLFKNSK